MYQTEYQFLSETLTELTHICGAIRCHDSNGFETSMNRKLAIRFLEDRIDSIAERLNEIERKNA